MRSAVVGCLSWLLVLGAAHAAPAASPPPLEAYGRLPAIDHVVISPSGDRIAYIGVQGDKRKLQVVDTAGKSLLVVDVGASKVRGLEWAGDDHIITKVTSTVSLQNLPGDMSEILSVAAFSISKHRGVVIFGGHNGVIQAVFGDHGVARVGDHWYGYYGAYVLNPGGSIRRYYPTLEKVDLDSGAIETVSTGGKAHTGWLVSPTGDLLAHGEYDEDTQTWRVVAGDTSSGETLATNKDPLGSASILGQGRRPGSVLIVTQRGSAGAVEEVSPGGSPVEIADGGLIGGFVFDSRTGLWIGRSAESDDRDTTFFDAKLNADVSKALELLPTHHARLVSKSDDFRRFIAMTNSGNDSGTYWVVDVDAQTAKPVGRAYPDVGPAQTGTVSMVSWTAQDGLPMHGVLTLPPGSSGHNLPLVVLPHGGPEARDYPDFDWWAQAFASRGYAVFQPNFRGSSGYGRSFRDAGFGEWGRKMQTDISDGVAALAAQGVVDPKRACIVGGSYGGYAALAGVTVQHGLYRCAAAYGGVSDLNGMLEFALGDVTHQESTTTRYWRTFMGASSNHDPKLNAYSPLSLASQADAPILLIHGRNDTVVPFRQSDDMARALQQAGKPVELLPLASEDHWLSSEQTRTQMLKAMVAFVEKNNPA